MGDVLHRRRFVEDGVVRVRAVDERTRGPFAGLDIFKYGREEVADPRLREHLLHDEHFRDVDSRV